MTSNTQEILMNWFNSHERIKNEVPEAVPIGAANVAKVLDEIIPPDKRSNELFLITLYNSDISPLVCLDLSLKGEKEILQVALGIVETYMERANDLIKQSEAQNLR